MVSVGNIVGNRYQLGPVLGSGGMGIVYSAMDLDSARYVAVKVLNTAVSATPRALRRLGREVAVLRALHSPHIAQFLDAGELDDGSPFIVMEYLEGRDLKLELKRRVSIPYPEACAYVLQACRGVIEAHAHHVVHRDLKPSNLVITCLDVTRSIKVVDFGVAKILRNAEIVQTPSSGTVVGTPLYVSPEQLIRNGELTPRSDLWSLGVILYELLSGESPFADDTPGAIVAAVVLDDPEPIDRLVPELPVGLSELIMQLMQKAPQDRPASAEVLAARLAPFAASDSELKIVDVPAERERFTVPRRRPKRKNPWTRPSRGAGATRQAPSNADVTVRRSAPVYERLASMRPSDAASCDAPTVVLESADESSTSNARARDG